MMHVGIRYAIELEHEKKSVDFSAIDLLLAIYESDIMTFEEIDDDEKGCVVVYKNSKFSVEKTIVKNLGKVLPNIVYIFENKTKSCVVYNMQARKMKEMRMSVISQFRLIESTLNHKKGTRVIDFKDNDSLMK